MNVSDKLIKATKTDKDGLISIEDKLNALSVTQEEEDNVEYFNLLKTKTLAAK